MSHIDALLAGSEVAEALAVEAVDGFVKEAGNNVFEFAEKGLERAEGVTWLVIGAASVGEAEDHIAGAAAVKVDLGWSVSEGLENNE